jgi:hypothetical protein
MKYAYIIGSNAFVVPSKVISYADGGEDHEFLRINSVYHDQSPPSPETYLDCDININDIDGTPFILVANKAVTGSHFTVETERNSINVLRPDGTSLIHIQQLDDESAMNLEHNISAELEVNMPVAAIRLFGEFKLGSLYINAENEKLFINDDGYANSVLAGANQLKFTTDGVVL